MGAGWEPCDDRRESNWSKLIPERELASDSKAQLASHGLGALQAPLGLLEFLFLSGRVSLLDGDGPGDLLRRHLVHARMHGL
jgi:hypothetical protein